MSLEYKIMRGSDPEMLALQVLEAIGQGWELSGGIAVSGWFSDWEDNRMGYTKIETTLYVQAMTRFTRPQVVSGVRCLLD